MKKLSIFLLVFLVGMSTGVVVGVKVGLEEFVLAEAQYKASSLAFQLAALKAGKTEPIITGMEISLDYELANHGKYMESHLTWLWPDLKSKDDRVIRRAVAYRLATPYKAPDQSKPENWNPGIDMESQFVKDTIEGQRILNHYLQKVLKHYGSIAHDGPLRPAPETGAAERGRPAAHP